MQLTRNDILQEIASMRQQEREFFAAANRANGAAQAFEKILRYFPEETEDKKDD